MTIATNQSKNNKAGVKMEKQNRAKEQAKAQLESIITLVNRLEHSQECDGEDCVLTDKQILESLNTYYKPGMEANEEEKQECHDEEAIREAFDEDPLCIEVRTDWHTPGEETKSTEYMILLCTGGPAVRIVGDLDGYQQPETANLEYQDWFTPWEQYPLTGEEEKTLLTYAQHFYFDV